jgi:hypothetical protein
MVAIDTDNIVQICVAIDIAILGIAYPIIIEKISNIGDKYASEYIPVLFDKELPQRPVKITINRWEYGVSLFKLSLLTTISSFVFLIFKFPPPSGCNSYLINNSAHLLVFTLTAFLVVSFVTWLAKVSLYSGKSKFLLTYLINKYNKSIPDTYLQNYHLKAINEITLYAIEKQDEHLQTTLLEFYSSLFSNIRMKHDNSKPLVYPADLYSLVAKLSETVARDEK